LIAGRDPTTYGYTSFIAPRNEQEQKGYDEFLKNDNHLRWFRGQGFYVFFHLTSIVIFAFTSTGYAALTLSASIITTAMVLTYNSEKKWDGIKAIFPNALRILGQVTVESWYVMRGVFGAIGAVYLAFAFFWHWMGRIYDTWSLGRCQHIRGGKCNCYDKYVLKTQIEERNNARSISADNEV
jgi:hypothetical protein